MKIGCSDRGRYKCSLFKTSLRRSVCFKKRYKRDILQVIKLKREIINPIKGFRTVNSHIGHMYCNFVNSAKNRMVSRYSDNDSDSSTENFYNSSRSAVSDIIINGPLDFFFI